MERTDPAMQVERSFEEFKSQRLAEGFDEVVERSWPPLTELPSHTHEFAVKALMVRGEMWLTQGAATQHLQPGDTFEFDRGVPHAERYGTLGATYWVARRGGAHGRHSSI